MLLFYRQNGGGQLSLPQGLEAEVVKPKLFGSVHNFLWGLLSKHREYRLYLNDGEKGRVCVSKAEVCSHFFIFRFFKKGFHIGPCRTEPEYRGNGYYPLLLKKILADHAGEELFMIVDDDNYASNRGVQKAGFKMFAKGEKRHSLYVVTEML